MTTTLDALGANDPSIRLRAALAVGTDPDPALLDALVGRCAVEPDFYVRDMLTWALTRLPAADTAARLLRELDSELPQARSQALHTLSKIGDRSTAPAVAALLHDPHDEVARSAWRAAVALVSDGDEAALATELAAELGRGDHDLQRSLSRALVALGEESVPILDAAAAAGSPARRAHAEATLRLHSDPDSAFTLSVEAAKRVAMIGSDQ
ncbi:HEAT repeat domain-containing protein [Prescottella sp. R16]|uniref:HEAT repeat domain-containing protein n=1 Tax=Prescottella sp. R16 TaxID=3064529 RepID=UPI00272EAAB6|nr:HEAT repeat domain-containing protein [Prescottella sp. R16]